MGKAKRQLKEARKEHFDSFKTSKVESESDHDDDDNDYYQQDLDVKMIELSLNIRSSIFEYVRHNAIPVCEYLDIANIRSFLEWALNNKS